MSTFFTETLFSAMSSMQKEKPKQLNPLLPGYAFDVFLVSGMTPIEQGSALDFTIDRPHGMKGFIVNLTIKGKGRSFRGQGLHRGTRRPAALSTRGGAPLRPGAGCPGVVSPLGLFPAAGLLD